MKKILIGVLTILLVAITLYACNEHANNRVVLTEYQYQNNAVPKELNGYRMMVISDLHNAPFQDQIVALAETAEPDVLIFSGDFVQLPGDSTKAITAIKDALPHVPAFAVSGDHESENEFYKDIKEALKAHQITLLEDEAVILSKNGARLLLYGANDPGMDYVTTRELEKMQKKMQSAFQKEEHKSLFKVAICHRPDLYDSIKHTGANLIFSGDLHGGVMRLPLYGGVFTKNCDYDYGYYHGENGASDLIVSGGCDQNPKKKRILNPPEVLLITLKGA